MLNLISNIGKDKSFVDDLSTERGIVSMRVAIVPRSAEIKPWFFDLWPLKITSFMNLMVRGGGVVREGGAASPHLSLSLGDFNFFALCFF